MAVPAHELDRSEDERMMGEEQLSPLSLGESNGPSGAIQGDNSSAHRSIEVPYLQSDLVKAERKPAWSNAFDRIKNLMNCRHVERV